jgi:preprotein translocase subunit SecG
MIISYFFVVRFSKIVQANWILPVILLRFYNSKGNKSDCVDFVFLVGNHASPCAKILFTSSTEIPIASAILSCVSRQEKHFLGCQRSKRNSFFLSLLFFRLCLALCFRSKINNSFAAFFPFS